MIIRKAELFAMDVPLSEPYTIAYESIDSATMLFLVLISEEGLQGIGCAAPAPEVTGETADAARAALESFCASTSYCPANALPAIAPGQPSASAALDLALHDIRARIAQTTVGGLFGNAHAAESPRETSVTIGISSVEDTLKRAESLTRQGFNFLKIKGGHNVSTDLDRLSALRDRFGADLRLALDANQGYRSEDVDRLETAASQVNLLYLEQPTPKNDPLMLGEAARRTGIPVMADEAVQSVDDVHRLGVAGPISLINIKLQKMGGLSPAAAIDRAAQETGMRTMLGCMDESALSIAAALHFGATHPNVQYMDLDGHFDLTQDPFADVVRLDGQGRLSTISQAGLGWIGMPFQRSGW